MEVPQSLDAPDSVSGDAALWAAEQFKDMFKAPHPVSKAVPSPRVQDLDIKAIMAEAWIRSGGRTLPPPLGLMPPPEAPDKRNVVLQVLEKSGAISATGGKPKVDDSLVSVPDPTNWDPLGMAWDTALDAVRERQRTESCSSGGGSCSSSGKHHHSSSHSGMKPTPRKTDAYRELESSGTHHSNPDTYFELGPRHPGTPGSSLEACKWRCSGYTTPYCKVSGETCSAATCILWQG